MTLKHILLYSIISVLCTFSFEINAQSKRKEKSSNKEFEDIGRRDLRNFGTIFENEQVKGYYMFSREEKTGGGMAKFKIEIFDDKLKLTKTIKLEKGKKAQLIEMSYNGEAFFLMMTNKKGVDLLTYNIEGKKLGEITIPKINKFERMRISQMIMSQEGSNASVYSLGNQGFVRQVFLKNKKLGYSIECYSNSLKLLWSYSSNATSDKVEAADIMYSSAKYIAVLKASKKNQLTKDVHNDFIMLDAENGKKVFELPMKEISELSVLGCHVDETKNEVMMNGEYFAKGKNIYNSKSEGLYIMQCDMEGTVLKMEKMSWKKDLLSLTVKDEEKGKSNENMRFYIHKVYTAPNGNTYIIAEQYKRIVSATAVALNALTSGSGNSNLSNISIKIYNLVYLVLDKDFKLIEKEVVKKKHSEFFLEKGYEFVSPTLLSHYIKAKGGFDYQFSDIDKTTGNFTAYYIDLNRKGADGKKNDVVIGSIQLIGDKIETKRTPINTSFPVIFIHPAKEGNILLREYSPGKNRMVVRFENLQ